MKNYLLVIFIFFINYPVKAAFIDNIHKLNISDGLSSGFVYDIVQDNNNLVWIATETGLNRYDGLNVKTYLNEHYNKKSLSNNQVQSLLFDDNNNTLWVGTNYGLNRYNYESDDFTPYYFSINNNKTADIVKILPSESENKLLLCSYYYGLILFDILSEDFYILGDSYLNKESFDALTIFDDKKENIWIGTQSKGIFCFGKNDSVLTNYNIDNNIAIRDFNIDKDENILCATSNGIYIKNYAENKFLKLQLDIYKDTEDFYFIRYINDNEIWIGSEDGIYIYKDLYGNRILNKIDMNETSFGLTFRSVRNIFQDKYMNIWISTYAGGVNYIPGSNPIFRNIKPSYIYNAKDGNDGINKILSITEDKKGNLLLGTDGFGIIKITKNHEFIERYDFNKMKKNINRNIIQSIFCDEEENLWIGTYEAGLIKYNPKLNDYKIFDYSNSDICGNDIRYIDCIDNEIYVCGKTGITIFDKQGSIKRNYRSGYKGLYAHDIRKMINISDDTILFGSYNGGIYIYSKKEDKFNSIQHNESDPSSLPDNMIEDFFYSSDNKLWVSTKNGELAYCENLSGDFTRINLPFTKGNICSIKEDEYGYLWLCYVNCIIRYNTESDQFDIYNNSQVISTGMYFGSAAYKDNNNIYYGGANGIIHFSPEKFITSMRPVIKPVFTDFKMYNNTVRISDENNITTDGLPLHLVVEHA